MLLPHPLSSAFLFISPITPSKKKIFRYSLFFILGITGSLGKLTNEPLQKLVLNMAQGLQGAHYGEFFWGTGKGNQL